MLIELPLYNASFGLLFDFHADRSWKPPYHCIMISKVQRWCYYFQGVFGYCLVLVSIVVDVTTTYVAGHVYLLVVHTSSLFHEWCEMCLFLACYYTVDCCWFLGWCEICLLTTLLLVAYRTVAC